MRIRTLAFTEVSQVRQYLYMPTNLISFACHLQHPRSQGGELQQLHARPA